MGEHKQQQVNKMTRAEMLRKQALNRAASKRELPNRGPAPDGANRQQRRSQESKLKHGLALFQRNAFVKLREKARDVVCAPHGNAGTMWWRIPASEGNPGGMHLLCNDCKVERVPGDNMLRVFDK